MTFTLQLLEFSIIALAISALTAIITRRLRLPYTVGLVVIGLLLGIINRYETIRLPEFTVDLVYFVENVITPELILGLLVTPIIFEAAFHIQWADFKRDFLFVLALAVPGVILTTILVGSFLYAETDLIGEVFPLHIAFIFGAMMAATDPVSVVSLFRSMGVPKRLQNLLEGESLLNDGTAIVVYALVLNFVITANTGNAVANSSDWGSYILAFIKVSGGGILVGIALGSLVSIIFRYVDEPLIETTLTTVLAFGTYLVADQLGVSGILAVVSAGLVNGNVGPQSMSPSTRILVTSFWEYAAFLSNSLIFLLIGLKINLTDLVEKWQIIGLAILAVLLARAVVVYGLSWVGRNIPTSWRHTLFWAGLRGAISLALALSLPLALDSEVRSSLQVMAFGVVLFTILIQGITMEPLVRRLGLTKRSDIRYEYERRHARAVAARAAYVRLDDMHDKGFVSHHTWNLASIALKDHASALSKSVQEVMEFDPLLESEEMETARIETLRAQKSALNSLLNNGVISEEVYSELVREIDDTIDRENESWAISLQKGLARSFPIRKLLFAVIQVQDAENVIQALNAAKVIVNRLSSTGGFLLRRNITLLIGVPEGDEAIIFDILRNNCQRRVEYISTPLEGTPLHLPLSSPITVGGAILFTLDVERCEEL